MASNVFYVVMTCGVSMALTFMMMPVLLRICKKKGLYDLPDARKVHHCAVPRLGGLLFLPAASVAFVLAMVLDAGGVGGWLTFRNSTLLMAVGVFLIYIIGLVDDLVGMKATHKFMVQFVAALVMPFCGLIINNFYGLFGIYELSFWVSYPLTVFVILLIINSINLIDGIDGLASGLSVCILSSFIYYFIRMDNTFVYAIVSAGVLGSVLAFFCFNMFGSVKNNTKIFMGDSGSLFLGYVLAYLSIKHEMNNPYYLPYRSDALLVSCTLMLIPTFDLVRVALGRLFRGKPIFGADKTHIHHRVMDAGFTMHQTWGIIIALYFFFGMMNYLLNDLNVAHTWIFILDVAVYMLFHAGLRLMAVHRRQGEAS